MRHLFLYGPPGSGKSTIGRLLAERLGLPFTDLDTVIVETAGRPIPQIFAEEGGSVDSADLRGGRGTGFPRPREAGAR